MGAAANRPASRYRKRSSRRPAGYPPYGNEAVPGASHTASLTDECAELSLSPASVAEPITVSLTPKTAPLTLLTCRLAACAGLTVSASVLTLLLRSARVRSICSRIWSGSLLRVMSPRCL